MAKDLVAALGKQPGPSWGPVDPVELFRSLKIRSTSAIKELWAPQADALREWHGRRGGADVLFQLNTGAGKTLIGLVAAQSLVNETRGLVAYCCVTRQLVEQTKEKADDLGLVVATYHGSAWTDREAFQRAQAPVITTYAALLNGKSIFRDEPIDAIVLDDAHTAHDAVRGAFTLSVDRSRHGGLYDAVAGLFRPYFVEAGRDILVDAILEGKDRSSVLMVPMFEHIRRAGELRAILMEHGVEEHRDLLFSWAHLGQKLDRCLILFDAESIHITPLLPPIGEVPAFGAGVRRLYLSATLRVDDELIRTFGRQPEIVISPGGRAGDTERLMLFPPAGASDNDAREWANAATKGMKAVIMVPTWPDAGPWESHAAVFRSEDGNERIRQFASSDDERLVFVARYDGIDLPDDDCRVMIVDGLPTGMPLLDRFFEQHLERVGISSARIASRFVQLLGRTSRGMSDYGVVLLVGGRLLNWVMLPAHRGLLPPHLQRQLQVGERLSALKDFSATELLQLCLRQDEAWIKAYGDGMEQAQAAAQPSGKVEEGLLRLAQTERAAADALWDDRPEDALNAMLGGKDEAFSVDRNLGGWFLHWAGLGAQFLGDWALATQLYHRAAAVKRDLGVIPGQVVPPAADAAAASVQATRMGALLQERGAERVRREIAEVGERLSDPKSSAAVHEEVIRVLGEYLGYSATRPEKETGGKGPDVLWVEADNALVVLFDAKTKKVNDTYDKALIGRSAQHSLWAKEEYPRAERWHFIVGPRVPATQASTPPPGIRVVEQSELARMAAELLQAYDRAIGRNLPLFFAAEILVGLEDSGLTWQSLPSSMESVRLDAL